MFADLEYAGWYIDGSREGDQTAYFNHHGPDQITIYFRNNEFLDLLLELTILLEEMPADVVLSLLDPDGEVEDSWVNEEVPSGDEINVYAHQLMEEYSKR
jgi:hypothetical protein